MYLPIAPKSTNAQAWLAAANAVRGNGGEAHNVVIDVADPIGETENDTQIIQLVDTHLRSHNVNGLNGVANTIFPQATLDRHGPEAFYGVYRNRLLPRMKKITRDWGRYFDRLTEWKSTQGNAVKVINPLDDLVQFMRRQIKSDRTYRNVYEMTIYDPTRDAGKVSNRQCLSFLSFKLDEENRLMLTAIYRNHAYIARGLGNFIGLGRLQRFVAEQSGATVGPLTCVSTHALIDHGRSGSEGWTQAQAHGLLDACRSANDSKQTA